MVRVRGLFAMIVLCVCALFIFSLSSCVRRARYKDRNEFEDDAIRLGAPLTCYNDFLGIEYTFPKGSWLYDVNSANLCPDRADTADAATLDIFYGDNFRRVNMASFANGRSSARKNHVGFRVDAEFREGVDSLAEYMLHFEERALQDSGGGPRALIDSGSELIGEKLFERRVFQVAGSGGAFRIVTLSAAARNGYFITVAADYWPENESPHVPLPGFLDTR